MKFPEVIRHRKAEVTLYGKKRNYAFYRIAYRVAGKRHLLNFSKYGEALTAAKKKARELAEGSQAATPKVNSSAVIEIRPSLCCSPRPISETKKAP